MERNIITFELRFAKDDDIAKALKVAIAKGTAQSDVIRAALRSYLLRPHVNPAPTRDSIEFEPADITITLKEIEKDDTQLDTAIDDLLNF